MEWTIMTAEFPELKGSDTNPPQRWDGGCLWHGIGVILGGLALGLLFIVISLTRAYRIESSQEPEITVITAETYTSEVHETATKDQMQNPVPTGTPGIPQGADFEVGEIVQVSGTAGQGLSLRNEPGLSAVIDGYGMEDEIFEVRGGPIEKDDYRWWFLISPYDDTKQGWGVGTYLVRSAP
jgi:hypothetical protein